MRIEYPKYLISTFNSLLVFVLLLSHQCIFKSAVSKSLGHLIAVSGVGSSPALATCETSQVLLAGVPGGFSRFPPPTDLDRLILAEIILKGTQN